MTIQYSEESLSELAMTMMKNNEELKHIPGAADYMYISQNEHLIYVNQRLEIKGNNFFVGRTRDLDSARRDFVAKYKNKRLPAVFAGQFPKKYKPPREATPEEVARVERIFKTLKAARAKAKK